MARTRRPHLFPRVDAPVKANPEYEVRRRAAAGHVGPGWVVIEPFLPESDERQRDPSVTHALYVPLLLAARKNGPLEPWQVRGVLRTTPHGIALVRVTVEHLTDPDREVTKEVLLRIPVATIRAQALAKIVKRPDYLEAFASSSLPLPGEWLSEAREHAENAASEVLRRGNVGYPDAHYKRIALRYLELRSEGHRDPIQIIAAEETTHLGRAVPPQTVRTWLRGAQKREWLAKSRRGIAGLEPGPKVRAMKEEN